VDLFLLTNINMQASMCDVLTSMTSSAQALHLLPWFMNIENNTD
jgi:hypothetical protein